MEVASLSELKKELKLLEKPEIAELCLRLARYKKDNKELLHFLLFDQQNLDEYIQKVKLVIDESFRQIGGLNLYLANKSLRKVLRNTNKYIKYSGEKQIEVELLIYFCQKLRVSGIKIYHSTQLSNLYQSQLAKIERAMAKLHEDLQFDYQQELERLR